MRNFFVLLFVFTTMFACQTDSGSTEPIEEKPVWRDLFNGKDLDGWTIKIAGSPANENYKNTFRVEDGLIKVVYDEYETFNEEFGHLFYNEKFSNYVLHVEYRFVGDQVPNGPGWAFRNSGVMFHAQSPDSMAVEQDFPICIEAQFLGGDTTGERSTGNLCTPGSNVFLADTLFTNHCISSTSKTYRGDQWVNFDLVVWGDSIIHHVVEGDTVLTYAKPHFGQGNETPETPIQPGHFMKAGFIALQAESHPVHFRKVAIMELSE